MRSRLIVFALGLMFAHSAWAQMPRGTVHWSLFPGFSNHGVLEMRQEYRASFNLTAGTTWQVRGLEISGLSSYNYRYFSGIQISGLSNVSGGYNAIQPKEKIDETFRGIQAAGVINKTVGSAVGAQVASINSVGGHITGFQWAGLFNYARSLQGVQLAGLFNSAPEGISGFQIASLFNYAGAQSLGIQFGLFNYCKTAGFMANPSNLFGDFYQIGLINMAGVSNGNQIGIINISKKNKGVPLGILNVDASHGYSSLRADDLFLGNLVISTGSRFYLNTFRVGYNFSLDGAPVCGMSYGLEQMWKEQDLIPRWYFVTGVHLVQLKEKDVKLLKSGRLLRYEAVYTRKVAKGTFIEMGLALNYSLHNPQPAEQGFLHQTSQKIWPGLILGYRL
ncbi:hypothetical protein QWY31_14670 [Cytophagales bacterium LB-30]|uniref:Porin n=1 Tax=Shiella aurantiaca TaxID=3058365 RepID=A0ABT8F8D6_9BACT|nr:hypothetical protein [Shiella aurantiaca]MDN4166752.1 hypothetical protein [Shiella aurantiaca]